MKKTLRYLSLMFALILLCPLALVGCSKNYTIKVEVVGSGAVLVKNVDGASVVGVNTVEKGEKFEYFVKPATNYEIVKIEIDGEVYSQTYDKNGTYLSFEDVSSNHTVKVTFNAKQYTVTFMCLGTEGVHEQFKQVGVAYGGTLDLNDAVYGGANNHIWYVFVGLGSEKDYFWDNEEDTNQIFVRKNLVIYTDYTRAELADLGVNAD